MTEQARNPDAPGGSTAGGRLRRAEVLAKRSLWPNCCYGHTSPASAGISGRKAGGRSFFLLVPFLRFFRGPAGTSAGPDRQAGPLRLDPLGRSPGFTLRRTPLDQQDWGAHRRHRSGDPGIEPAPVRHGRARLLRRLPLRVSHGSHHRHQHLLPRAPSPSGDLLRGRLRHPGRHPGGVLPAAKN